MFLKKFYFVLAVLFSVIVLFDFFILIQSFINDVSIHPQLKQHLYFNPPLMLFCWYLAFKNKNV